MWRRERAARRQRPQSTASCCAASLPVFRVIPSGRTSLKIAHDSLGSVQPPRRTSYPGREHLHREQGYETPQECGVEAPMPRGINDDYGEWQQIICHMYPHNSVQEVPRETAYAGLHGGDGRQQHQALVDVTSVSIEEAKRSKSDKFYKQCSNQKNVKPNYFPERLFNGEFEFNRIRSP